MTTLPALIDAGLYWHDAAAHAAAYVAMRENPKVPVVVVTPTGYALTTWARQKDAS